MCATKIHPISHTQCVLRYSTQTLVGLYGALYRVRFFRNSWCDRLLSGPLALRMRVKPFVRMCIMSVMNENGGSGYSLLYLQPVRCTNSLTFSLLFMPKTISCEREIIRIYSHFFLFHLKLNCVENVREKRAERITPHHHWSVSPFSIIIIN